MRIIASDPNAIIQNAARVTAREIGKRIGHAPDVVKGTDAGNGDVVLALRSELGEECFEIAVSESGVASVAGGNPQGVYYGCGKLLRSAKFADNEVTFFPCARQAPQKPIRGIYFATHFCNYYECAPREELRRYIEELALWGINVFIAWYDMHQYEGIHDPKAQKHLERLRFLHEAARNAGMRVGLAAVANESYDSSPTELRADQAGIATFAYGVELCPSKPEGMALILNNIKEELDQFEHLDFLWLWPYDSGGCSCERCSPWGANGFLKAGEKVAAVLKNRWPESRLILSTWLFDYPGNASKGEWDGLLEKMRDGLDWVDLILADGHEQFPSKPLETSLPGDVPMVNFPELSMLKMTPWGSYGANPLPAHWQQMMDLVGSRIIGSFPYSEGIYEDINKIMWARKNWDNSQSMFDIMSEYAAYEFSPDYAQEIAHAMELMETTHEHFCTTEGVQDCVSAPNLDAAEEIWSIVSAVDPKLPAWARNGWRWRLIFLRAKIDAEIKSGGGRATPALRDAFGEIWKLYYAQEDSWMNLRPVRMPE